jgi:tetratricopeptide (TPR) repeat protein
MEIYAPMETQKMESIRRRPSRRLPLLLGVLVALVVVGVVRYFRSPGYHERRLRQMSVSELQQWTAREDSDALAQHYLGVAYQGSGQRQKAAEAYVRALNLDPTLSSTRSKLAGVLVMSGQSRAAETLLLEGVKIDPKAAELHKGLGQIYEERQDFRRAAESWEKTTTLAPKDPIAWFHLGHCWIGLNDEARALPGYERAVALDPLSADYQKAFAGVLRLRGRLPEAEQHCRRAIQLRPDDPEAYFNLMKILRDREGATPQAEEAIQKAVALQADNPQYHYYLATILQERGKHGESAKAYIAALKLFKARRPRGLTAQWNDYGLWLSYVEGSHFNLARLLKRLGLPKESEKELAVYRRLSKYHQSANQLIGVAANQPKNAALRFQLARLHAAAGFIELAEEQAHAGQELQQATGHEGHKHADEKH